MVGCFDPLGLIFGLIILHSAEILTWAQFFFWSGNLPDRETATYYSLMSYTTVGYSDVLLPLAWRLLGGLEAMIGVLLFGWSTACLVSLVYYIQNSLMKKHLGHIPE